MLDLAVNHVHRRAVDISPRGSGARITLSDGPRLAADRVVLAPGASPSIWPEHLGSPERPWVANPWRPGALADLPPGAPVLLIGTGLTAVDVALTLVASSDQDVVAVSRHGWLPAAWPDEPPPAQTLTPPIKPSARTLVSWVRALGGANDDWATVIDALRPHTNTLWATMTPADRRRLLRLAHRRWEVLRHRMAPPVAAQVATMQDDGRFTVVRGRVTRARTTAAGVEIELAGLRRRVAAVVNCAGAPLDIRHSADPLVRTLLSCGVARPGPLHLGLDVDARGSQGGAGDTIWLVGPLRRGEAWETTAIPEISSTRTSWPAVSLGCRRQPGVDRGMAQSHVTGCSGYGTPTRLGQPGRTPVPGEPLLRAWPGPPPRDFSGHPEEPYRHDRGIAPRTWRRRNGHLVASSRRAPPLFARSTNPQQTTGPRRETRGAGP